MSGILLNQAMLMDRKTLLILELVVLFGATPIALYFYRSETASYIIALLLCALAWCFTLLLLDPRFKRFRLWNMDKFREHLPQVLRTFALGAVIITVASWLLAPEYFFALPLEHTAMWLTLLVLYPLLSAWPQELIFRTFLFHRYKNVVQSKQSRALLSATSFACAHLVFANWIAVVGSFFAGLLFARTYMRSRSTLLVAVEHSLWGCWLFTAGLGIHFDSSMIGSA